MINVYITESSIHYIAGLLDRYADKFPTKHHQDAMKEIRLISDKLLETLEQPVSMKVIRHRLQDEQ